VNRHTDKKTVLDDFNLIITLVPYNLQIKLFNTKTKIQHRKTQDSSAIICLDIYMLKIVKQSVLYQ